jgi:S-adenosylmethionine decarboxylase
MITIPNLTDRKKFIYTKGIHILLDIWNSDKIHEKDFLIAMLKEAAVQGGCKVLQKASFDFGSMSGITGFIMLAESHIAIHTWPEDNFIAIDIYMCGQNCSLEVTRNFILEHLKPEHFEEKVVIRDRAVKT